jgi:hypothetical protein
MRSWSAPSTGRDSLPVRNAYRNPEHRTIGAAGCPEIATMRRGYEVVTLTKELENGPVRRT